MTRKARITDLMMFFTLIGVLFLFRSCLVILNSAEAQYSPPQICYGQHKPICPLGARAVCLCTGPIGQDCRYVCIADAHDRR